MSQTEFDELINEIEDMLSNNKIDINKSPQLKKSLEEIISKYVRQTIMKVERSNYDYYKKRSNQAVNEVKKEIVNNYQIHSNSIDNQMNSLIHKSKQNSVLASRISNNNSLKNILNKINNIQQSIKKLKLLLIMMKSKFLMISYCSTIIGILMAVITFTLIKIF